MEQEAVRSYPDRLLEARDQIIGAEDDEHERHAQACSKIGWIIFFPRRRVNGARDYMEVVVEHASPDSILFRSSHDFPLTSRGAEVTNAIYFAGVNEVHDRAGRV
jgi:hypothetical protein